MQYDIHKFDKDNDHYRNMEVKTKEIAEFITPSMIW